MSARSHCLWLLSLIPFTLSLLPVSATAQTTFGSLEGSVFDQSLEQERIAWMKDAALGSVRCLKYRVCEDRNGLIGNFPQWRLASYNSERRSRRQIHDVVFNYQRSKR